MRYKAEDIIIESEIILASANVQEQIEEIIEKEQNKPTWRARIDELKNTWSCEKLVCRLICDALNYEMHQRALEERIEEGRRLTTEPEMKKEEEKNV